MKNLIILTIIIFMAISLSAEEFLVWIEANPDTIYYDNNVTYSIITVKVEDEFEEPVEGAHITFGSSIGNLISNATTNENGIASTDFWESGDIGIATINATRNGQVLTTYVTILPPVDSPESDIPNILNNIQIYPNPFNPETTISFSLEYAAEVVIDIYNSKGQKIKRILNDRLDQGLNKVSWKADRDTPSGIYFAKISMGSETEIKKMILMK